MMPIVFDPAVKGQLHSAQVPSWADARSGIGGIQLPEALERKCPRARGPRHLGVNCRSFRTPTNRYVRERVSSDGPPL